MVGVFGKDVVGVGVLRKDVVGVGVLRKGEGVWEGCTVEV